MRRAIVIAVVLVAVAAGGWWFLRNDFGPTDPYLWLENIRGDKSLAWVMHQNARTLRTLGSDPDYDKDYASVLSDLDATDRIPFGGLEHQYVFNFWRDKTHAKGIWRRTTIADYAKSDPHWETLLDVDKLAADEQEDWVYKGRNCSPSLTRCLISLSRGGGDAVTVREYDLGTKTFVKNGFKLDEAKSYASFVGDNSVIFATNFGGGTMTASGYPRIVKLWTRGTPIANAKPVFDGKQNDVTVDPLVFHTRDGSLPIIVEGMSFFDAAYYIVNADGSTTKADLPQDAVLQGVHNGQLIATLREDWKAGNAPKGALVAVPMKPGGKVDVLYAPGPRASVEEVSVGRDAVYAAIYENVVGQIRAFRLDPRERHVVEHRAGAAAGRFGPHHVDQRLRSRSGIPFREFPDARDALCRLRQRQACRNQIGAGTFRCIQPHHRAIRSDVEGRHQGSVFRDAAESDDGPCAGHPLWLWRFRSVHDAFLLGQVRHAVAVEGRRLCACQHPRRW